MSNEQGGKSNIFLDGYRQGWYTPQELDKQGFTSYEDGLAFIAQDEALHEVELLHYSEPYRIMHRDFLNGLFAAKRDSLEVYFDMRAKGIAPPPLFSLQEEGEKRSGQYIAIDPKELTATDLKYEQGKHVEEPHEAYRLYFEGQEETADVLYFPAIGRMGIVWGNDATWASVESAREGMILWLNYPQEWEKRK